MKNFDAYTAKQITTAAIPKKVARRLREEKKEYKGIKKLIYAEAKHGNSSICINYFSLRPEVYQWLEEDGFKIEYIQSFSYKISWD